MASGRCFAVTVAPDVLAYDLDSPAEVAAGECLAAELVAAGWPLLRVESGRPGHRHLFAVVPNAQARRRLSARARALGMPAARAVIRPPGSPHHSGRPVRLLDDPTAFVAAVAELREPLAPFHWQQVLATGEWPKGWTRSDTTRSNLTFWICLRALRHGHTKAEIEAMLADPANAGGEKYREKVADNDADWLTRFWPEVTKWAGRRRPPAPLPADAHEARQCIAELMAEVEAQRWPGVGGGTDRAIALALLQLGHDRGSLTPTMSYRQIAEAARCHVTTVPRSVRRLRQRLPWLQVIERGRGRTVESDRGELTERADATTWRFVPSARTANTGGTPPASTSLGVSSARALADVGRCRGIGQLGVRVLEALTDGPLDARELAERLQANVGNLRYRRLPALLAQGLIVRAGDGWAVLEPDALETALVRVAGELGLAGKADAVAAAHRVQRAGYLEHREHLRGQRYCRARQTKASWFAERRAKKSAQQATLPLPFAPQHPLSPSESRSGPSIRCREQEWPPDIADDDLAAAQ